MHARDYRSSTRADLIRTHIGPDTLEEATQSYINRNVDLYDLSYMVQVGRLKALTDTSNLCLYPLI